MPRKPTKQQQKHFKKQQQSIELKQRNRSLLKQIPMLSNFFYIFLPTLRKAD